MFDLPQLSSSSPLGQSSCPLHLSAAGMHDPSEQVYSKLESHSERNENREEFKLLLALIFETNKN